MRSSRVKIVGIATVACALWGASAALAVAGDNSNLTSPMSAYDWNGFYLGAHAGYRSATGDAGNSSWSPGLPYGSLDPDGLIGGFHAGYDLQVQQFVFGVRGNLTFADQSDSFTAAGPTTWRLETGTQGSLVGRAGYAFGNVLPYVTAGIAVLDTQAQYSQLGLPAVSDSNTLTGWTLGAGIEYGVNDWLSLTLDYSFADYGTQRFQYSATPLFSTYDTKSHTLTFGTNVRF